MTKEEFAKLFPGAKWPRTREGVRGTDVLPGDRLRATPGFSDPPLTARPPGSMGLMRHRTPSARERLTDLIHRNLYGDPGAGTREHKQGERLAALLDFTPLGALNQAYDTGRALGEGRFDDAQASGLAFLPAVRKSPVNGLFNPKAKSPRPFSADYPGGAGALNEHGELAQDIEGRPLQAPLVAGRVRADEPDHALMPVNIQSIGEQGTGGSLQRVPPESMPAGSLGETHLRHGRPWEIRVANNLTGEKADMATAHEVGHVIDALSGRIPVGGLEAELDFNYNALRTGEERKHILSRPEDFGYKGELAHRERMAEAIRAYMVDPNYLKTVAPKTAARIRKFVAESPDLSKIIQFNSLAAGGALTAAGLARTGEAEAHVLPRNDAAGPAANSADRTKDNGLGRLIDALLERGIDSRSSRPEFDDLVQAIIDRQTRPEPRPYGRR